VEDCSREKEVVSIRLWLQSSTAGLHADEEDVVDSTHGKAVRADPVSTRTLSNCGGVPTNRSMECLELSRLSFLVGTVT